MIVVADTSPINYLVLIGEIELLSKLYLNILIPPAVAEELKRPKAPIAVQRWMASPPAWLNIVSPTGQPDADLIEAELDEGERDALLLAQEVKADQIIIDDMGGRLEAKRRHFQVTGTLGVLEAASKKGLVVLSGALLLLRQTNFHVSRELIDQLLKDSGS
jgi:predicted nucleic acid-binding protein